MCFRHNLSRTLRTRLRKIISTLVVIAMPVCVAILAPTARAATIASYTGGTILSSGSNFELGQSVTTPTGGPWNNISINFYSSGGNPFASGNLYLLSQSYSGTASALSSSTSGFIGSATASGNLWTFTPSTTLSANTQYFFYEATSPTSEELFGNSGIPSGGSAYEALGSGDFSALSTDSENYTLSGQVAGAAAPAPQVGAGPLSWMVLAFGGLFVALRRSIPMARKNPSSA
jgi:hypothetical protein